MNSRVKDLKRRAINKSSVGDRYADDVFVDMDRGRLYMESYQETDGEPEVLRRANALKKLLEELPIYIKEGELIVGGSECHPRAIISTFELSGVAAISCREDGYVRKEDQEDFDVILDYWKNRNMWTRVRRVGNLDEVHVYNANTSFIAEALSAKIGAGSNQPDYTFVFQNGFNNIIKRMDEKLAHATDDVYGPQVIEAAKKSYQWQAMKIASQAAVDWSQRYAAFAKFLASEEQDVTRKRELLRMAEVCDCCLAEPVKDFQGAVQAMWFIQALTHRMERFALGTSVRIDQILYPYYRKSVEEKKDITRDDALEMLELMFFKLLEGGYAQTRDARETLQGAALLQIYTLGGVDADGNDACNEVTKLCFDATRETRATQPSYCLRMHSKVPDEYLKAGFEVVKTGMAIPSFENDSVVIPMLMNSFDATLEQARTWALILCKSGGPTGRWGTPRRRPWSLGAAGVMSLIMNNGVDPISGIKMGPETNPTKWKSMEDAYEAYRKQAGIGVHMGQRMRNVAYEIEAEYLHQPFLSSCFEPFIEKGVDVMEHDELPVPWFNINGMVDAGDSLAVIKKLVFDDRKYTMQQLIEALGKNWEGCEGMRQDCLNAPKWGNDDDYADECTKRVYDIIVAEGLKVKDRWGVSPRPLPQSVTQFRQVGKITGATPNGRPDRDVLCDGGVSPRYGSDKKGPTAVLRSCAKLDNTKARGILLNQRFSPSILQGEKGWQLFRAYMKTWHDLMIEHVQINVVDTAALKAAQAEPDKFPDLVVRVAGYSAYFTSLDKQTQESIIQRTEQVLA